MVFCFWKGYTQNVALDAVFLLTIKRIQHNLCDNHKKTLRKSFQFTTNIFHRNLFILKKGSPNGVQFK